jgi:hypothetical protein
MRDEALMRNRTIVSLAGELTLVSPVGHTATSKGHKHADAAGTRGQVLESSQVRHDHDARPRWCRGRPRPADDRADRRRTQPDLVFTVKENALVQNLGKSNRAIATFTSKGHDLFATVHGSVSLDRDRATIDRLWNRFVAAWYEGGKDDPRLALLRLDAERAEIWLDASSLLAGIKLLLGADPKAEYKDNVAKVALT